MPLAAGDSGINEGAGEPYPVPEPLKPDENPELLPEGTGTLFEGTGTLSDGVGTAVEEAAVFIAATRLSDASGLSSDTADISPRPNVKPSFAFSFTLPTAAGAPQTAQNFAPRFSSRPHLPQYVFAPVS